jgi:hypothetical protein
MERVILDVLDQEHARGHMDYQDTCGRDAESLNMNDLQLHIAAVPSPFAIILHLEPITSQSRKNRSPSASVHRVQTQFPSKKLSHDFAVRDSPKLVQY